jgi:lysine-N-methylase
MRTGQKSTNWGVSVIYRNISNYNNFQCLADACPDTCCSGWEIDLDPEILEKYNSLSGPIGDIVSGHIHTQDGYTCFRREGAQCPFLTDTNLCRLILELGEDYLSITCREHPRFVEEYGNLQETCLSISCPEAARLLLAAPPEIITRETAEIAQPDPDLDPDRLAWLLESRDTLYAIARAKRPLGERLSLLLIAAEDLQTPPEAQPSGGVLETHVFRQEPADPKMLEAYFSTVEVPEMPLGLPGFLIVMKDMEFTSERLPRALTQVRPEFAESPAGENLLVYFLYRYVLRAVWDGDLTTKVRFSAYSAAAILALAQIMPLQDAASLYSREVEHSDENLELLYDFLMW